MTTDKGWEKIAQKIIDKACDADGDLWFRREMTIAEAESYAKTVSK